MGRERAPFHLSIAFAVFPHLFIFVFGVGRLEVPGAMEMGNSDVGKKPAVPRSRWHSRRRQCRWIKSEKFRPPAGRRDGSFLTSRHTSPACVPSRPCPSVAHVDESHVLHVMSLEPVD